MMVVFATWRNPLLYAAVKLGDRKERYLCKELGISLGTLTNWRKGTPITDGTAEKVFEGAQKLIVAGRQSRDEKERAVAAVREFQEAFDNPREGSLYESAALLGLSVDDCQNIIDEAIYTRLPLFPGLFYDTLHGHALARDTAEHALNRYKGLYYAWVRREGGWLRCPLRVRYTLKIGHGIVIRCKLNIPALNKERKSEQYWEYDGHMAVRRGIKRIYWMFEQRGDEDSDYFQFITDVGGALGGGRGSPSFVMAGNYLTTGQDSSRPLLSDDILLERTDLENVAEMERAMHAQAEQITDPAEIARVEDLLKKARARD
jgi:hypothetical protein